MQQSLASQVREWTINSLLLPLLGPTNLHSLQPLAEHVAFSRKVALTLPFPEGPEVASSIMSETQ